MKKRHYHSALSCLLFILIMVIVFCMVGCSATNREEEPKPTESTYKGEELEPEENSLLVEEEPAKTSVRDFPNNRFSLCESFYDGTSLTLAYKPESMIYPVEFGLVPDNLDDLQNMGRWYINAGWQTSMTQEDYEHVAKMLREEEQCGFVLRYFYLGDHICLTDGTDLGPWVGMNEGGTVFMKWPSETSQESNQIHSSLPREAQNRDALELVLKIREIVEYHYKDGDTYYYGNELLGEKTVVITVIAH